MLRDCILYIILLICLHENVLVCIFRSSGVFGGRSHFLLLRVGKARLYAIFVSFRLILNAILFVCCIIYSVGNGLEI